MSLNIQTSTGLVRISDKATKEKIVSALGYTPANETHTKDTDIHVSSEDRQTWNNKSNFSGDYNELTNAPIEENKSGDMVITDENGHIIMRVNENGVNTTNVDTETINLDGKDLATKLNEIEANLLPNIVDNLTNDLIIIDKNNNIIVKIDENGLETTAVVAKSMIINGIDVEAELKNTIKTEVINNAVIDEILLDVFGTTTE